MLTIYFSFSLIRVLYIFLNYANLTQWNNSFIHDSFIYSVPFLATFTKLNTTVSRIQQTTKEQVRTLWYKTSKRTKQSLSENKNKTHRIALWKNGNFIIPKTNDCARPLLLPENIPITLRWREYNQKWSSGKDRGNEKF